MAVPLYHPSPPTTTYPSFYPPSLSPHTNSGRHLQCRLLSSSSYNTIINTHLHNNEPERALHAFRRMLLRAPSLLPDCFTLPSVFKACAELAAFREGEQAHCWVFKIPHASRNLFVLNSLLRMYGRCGHPSAAGRVFETMPTKNVFSWNSMIDAYARAGDLDSARFIFSVAEERNVVSWNSMIAGYVRNGMFFEAIHLFAELLGSCADVLIDETTLLSVCSAVSGVGLLAIARKIHGYSLRCGYSMSGALGVAFIDMYAKCGDVSAAYGVFDCIQSKVVEHWTAMIFGFGSHGRPDSALELFVEMQEHGVQPNYVTFLGLLSACSHGGLLVEGLEHFRLMKNVFKIVPRVEHYGCLVDLLSRLGFIDEAKMVIDSMPMQVGVVIWSSLLAACRSHGRMDMVEMAAQKLVELEPESGRLYILLSDIYAKFDRWEEFCRMRRYIKERGIKKIPGFSWIEVDGQMHQFTSSDKFHPLSSHIYCVLEELENLIYAIRIADLR